MKVHELKTLVESIASEEIKKRIIESTEGKKGVFHIKCDGKPIDTFDTHEEAQSNLDKYKIAHPDKELIIEPEEYVSHEDMIDKLDDMSEEEECDECGSQPMEESSDVCSECGKEVCECGKEQVERQGLDYEKILRGHKTSIHEKKEPCLNCDREPCICDLDIQESNKKKTIRLTQMELAKLINEMVNDTMSNGGVPGISVTKKAQAGSKKENDSALSDVDKKMKNYLSFEGNKNEEFPTSTKKGDDPVKINNTKEQDEEVAKNFAGLQNLDYDIEPSETFKKRLKMAIEGDSLMGNANTTPKPSIKPSNGADKGKESDDKTGNNIPTETAKKIEKQVKDRAEDKKNRVLYTKERVPVSENKTLTKEVLTEEINKMMKIVKYNSKTQ